MRILSAGDHAKLVLEARDKAKRRLFILSHRLGLAARSVAVLPALAAVKAKNIEALLFYGRVTEPLSGTDGAAITREFGAEGVAIRPVHRPRLHAKVLGWDDDTLAVSSQNWLSADPPDSSSYRELGIVVEAPRIADTFLRRFEHSKID